MKLTSHTPEPTRVFTLELTEREANHLRAILGNIAGAGKDNPVRATASEIYRELVLHNTQCMSDPFQNVPKWADRI